MSDVVVVRVNRDVVVMAIRMMVSDPWDVPRHDVNHGRDSAVDGDFS